MGVLSSERGRAGLSSVSQVRKKWYEVIQPGGGQMGFKSSWQCTKIGTQILILDSEFIALSESL